MLEDISGIILVDLRCVRLHGLLNVQHEGQFLVLHLQRPDTLHGRHLVLRDDHSHIVAVVADMAVQQVAVRHILMTGVHGPGVARRGKGNIRYVKTGQHLHHAVDLAQHLLSLCRWCRLLRSLLRLLRSLYRRLRQRHGLKERQQLIAARTHLLALGHHGAQTGGHGRLRGGTAHALHDLLQLGHHLAQRVARQQTGHAVGGRVAARHHLLL